MEIMLLISRLESSLCTVNVVVIFVQIKVLAQWVKALLGKLHPVSE